MSNWLVLFWIFFLDVKIKWISNLWKISTISGSRDMFLSIVKTDKPDNTWALTISPAISNSLCFYFFFRICVPVFGFFFYSQRLLSDRYYHCCKSLDADISFPFWQLKCLCKNTQYNKPFSLWIIWWKKLFLSSHWNPEPKKSSKGRRISCFQQAVELNTESRWSKSPFNSLGKRK